MAQAVVPYEPSSDEEGSDEARASTLEAEAQLRVFKGWFKSDSQHSSNWRKEAKDDFDFVANDQWSPTDRSALEDQNRPVITFNRTLTIIKAVAGIEINGRHEISYLPRNNEDAAVNETLSGASKWMADNCDGEDEESEAFQHALVCGMGWAEERLDFETDQDGKYIEECIDPLEMYWDHTAKKKNLVDARRLWRVRTMPLGEAQALFPDANRYELDASWAAGMDSGTPDKTREEKWRRDENVSGTDLDAVEVTLVHVQWWEREVYWLVADPSSGTKHELPDEQFKILQKRAKQIGLPIASAKMTKRAYKQAFVGAKILESSPAPITDRFSWTCITGEQHKNKRTWFGLIKIMRDPQMWANKWLSQSLHILNTTAKGGILAEKDAFDDQRQAEETYAKPDAITWMAKGALASQGGQKVMPKPGGTFPQGHMELMTFAITALRDVTGINLELLGLKDVNQPGILEAQRKQAGMTILATMFDSLRRFRKIIGRNRLYFIQNFLNDGRLIRIVGPDGAKVVPLLRDKTIGNYDVVVDDTPNSPNQKDKNWQIIIQIMPAFKDQLVQNPELLVVLLEYSPLPSKVIEAIKKMLNAPKPEEQRQKQLSEQTIQSEIERNVAAAMKDRATAEKTKADVVIDIAEARAGMQHGEQEAQLAALKTHNEMATSAVKAQAEQASAAARMYSDQLEAGARMESDAAKAEHDKAKMILGLIQGMMKMSQDQQAHEQTLELNERSARSKNVA